MGNVTPGSGRGWDGGWPAGRQGQTCPRRLLRGGDIVCSEGTSPERGHDSGTGGPLESHHRRVLGKEGGVKAGRNLDFVAKGGNSRKMPLPGPRLQLTNTFGLLPILCVCHRREWCVCTHVCVYMF